MNLRHLSGTPLKVIVSISFALIFYFIWVNVSGFAFTFGKVGYIIQELSDPLLTAIGFATGIAIYERLAKIPKTKFLRILLWPLIGCAIGAGVTFRFAPGWLVLGMLAIGAESIVLREAAINRKERKTNPQIRGRSRKTILIISLTLVAFLILITPWVILTTVFTINPQADADAKSSIWLSVTYNLFRWGCFFVFFVAGYALKEALLEWDVDKILKSIVIFLLFIALFWAAISCWMTWFMEMPA